MENHMYYVYFLRSLQNPSKTYIGYTIDIKKRLDIHNIGASFHTNKYKPWKLVAFIAFDTEDKAINFEKYVKIGSGQAFAFKRIW